MSDVSSHRQPLKLSEFEQWKSFVRIGKNGMLKRIIHKSAMKISIIHSQHNLFWISDYNSRFKKWLSNFALGNTQAGKVKKVNN